MRVRLLATLALVATLLAAAPVAVSAQDDPVPAEPPADTPPSSDPAPVDPPPAEPPSCVTGCAKADTDDGSIGTVVWDTKPGSGTDGESGGTVVVSRPPAWLQACTWDLYGPGDVVPPDLFGTTEEFAEPTWVVACPLATRQAHGLNLFGPGGVIEVFPDTDIPPTIVAALLREARDQTELVSFYPTSAPAGNVEAPMITRFPTWLWIPEADWVPVTSTASIPPLSITVTAVPVSAEWSGADEPATVTCTPGTAYDWGRDYEAQESDCSVLFLHSSAAADYQLDLLVTWSETYVCSRQCGAGSLPDDFTSSSRTVRVAEIQSLVTSSG